MNLNTTINLVVCLDVKAFWHNIEHSSIVDKQTRGKGKHGPTWANVGIHGHTYAYIGIHGHTWAYTGIHGHTQANTDRQRHTQTYLGIQGQTWAYMRICVHTLGYVGIHGHTWRTWAYMGIHGHTWAYMGIHRQTQTGKGIHRQTQTSKGIHGQTLVSKVLVFNPKCGCTFKLNFFLSKQSMFCYFLSSGASGGWIRTLDVRITSRWFYQCAQKNLTQPKQLGQLSSTLTFPSLHKLYLQCSLPFICATKFIMTLLITLLNTGEITYNDTTCN